MQENEEEEEHDDDLIDADYVPRAEEDADISTSDGKQG